MSSVYRGVYGIYEIKGEIQGPSQPTLYVGTYTHGDELLSGSPILALLKGDIRLKRGRILLAINNLEATQMGLRVVPGEIDFNRLPLEDVMTGPTSNPSLSMQRLQTLGKIVLEATHALEIHTTPSKPYPAMRLPIKGDQAFSEAIDAEISILNITHFQKDCRDPEGSRTLAFGDYIGGLENPIPVVELEGGGPQTVENNPRLYQSILSATLSVLARLDMIDPEEYGIKPKNIIRKVYEVIDWQWAPPGYVLHRLFEPFAYLKKGDVVMEDGIDSGLPPILMPEEGHLVLHPSYKLKDGKPVPSTYPRDWFISKPVRVESVEALYSFGISMQGSALS